MTPFAQKSRVAWFLWCVWLSGCSVLTKERSLGIAPRSPDLDLVRQVLAERLVADDLPDLDAIRRGAQVAVSPVVALPGGNLLLTPDDLPRIPGRTIRLLDPATARAEADATHDEVFYLELAVANRTNETATVWFAVRMAMPLDSSARRMCCCERSARFAKVDDIWRFAGWDRGTCI